MAQDDNRGCDANCTLSDITKGFIRCGKVVSTHPKYGDKCVYLTKSRDNFGSISNICENLLIWTNKDGVDIKTGSCSTGNQRKQNTAQLQRHRET